ncbi:serine/threonine-protein kinase [Paractinoplanes atraurantiacus]|uniref:non-specific serine/threonine protein kinase n=1 Tax=Paractinoplanes atraurantiacus TaxID=1036182 RepID=A0A285KEI0_9ACTN|nr:serine/threonine-protein kinase [Actinoplanes atraurantiacus]SNY71029.1 serine/threonine protein kinase [Actinoplanes atraurantiacus]
MNGQLLGGRYRLLAPVGRGGMAVVWRAHDDVLARTVAVKVLAPSQVGDPASRDRIRHEARAAAALSHPNVAQVHDYGEMTNGTQVFPYVVMELIPGGTLLRRLCEGPVSPRFAMRVGAEIAAALAAAHAEDLVHCDIKPANVMLAPTGAKVVDFGIAAATSPGSVSDEVLGTPAYLAPERLLDAVVEPASDMYALGVVLYRLFSGRSPWTSTEPTQILKQHIHLNPKPLSLLPGVPDYVADLTNRCLSKNPATRPTAREAATLLARGAGLRVVTDDHHPFPATSEPPPEPSVLIPTARQLHRITPAPATAPGSSPTSPAPPAETAHPALPAEAANPAPPAEAADRPTAEPSNPRHRGAHRWAAVAALATCAAAGAWLALPDDDAKPAESAPPAPGSSPSAPASATAAPPVPGARTSARARAAATSKPATTPPSQIVSAAPAGPASSPGPASPSGPATPPGPAVPPGPAGTATPNPTPTYSPPAAQTFSSAAGTIKAICPTPTTAKITSWQAIKPYRVLTADGGPSRAPAVTYKQGKSLVTMTVTCTAGTPSVALSETAESA